MAKSTRSKVKRAYRAKKREDGVYAAIEAARLQRLSAKLAEVRNKYNDADDELAPLNPDQEDGMDQDQSSAGSSQLSSAWFLLFGLVDPDEVGFENLERIGRASEAQRAGLLGLC